MANPRQVDLDQIIFLCFKATHPQKQLWHKIERERGGEERVREGKQKLVGGSKNIGEGKRERNYEEEAYHNNTVFGDCAKPGNLGDGDFDDGDGDDAGDEVGGDGGDEDDVS